MNHIYRLFLAINATSWVVVIYGIKEEWTIARLSSWGFGICLLFIPIILSIISVIMTLLLDKDNLSKCVKLEEVNNSFLPTYLGYFFVGLGIDKVQHLIFVYLIILVFTFVAQQQYFNPIFLLLGYRFYNSETSEGKSVFLIAREDYRGTQDVGFTNLRRINNTTYIAWRNK